MSSLLLLGAGAAGRSASTPPSTGFHGVQVKKSADQTTVDYTAAAPGTAIAWDGEVFDTDTFHDAGDNTKIIIPSNLNGYWVVLSCMVQVDSLTANTVSVAIFKNGAAFHGGGNSSRNSGAGSDGVSTKNWAQCRTHPIQVATGDYFEAMLAITSDTSVTIEADSSFFDLHVVGATIEGALAVNSVNRAGQNISGSVNLTFDTDSYDSDGFHDTGSNTSRLTVPVAYNGRYGIIKANYALQNVSNSQQGNIVIKKNGGSFTTASVQNMQNGPVGHFWIDTETQPTLLATGDYFEMTAYCQDTSVQIDAIGTAISIQILPAGFKGALCQMNADATANYTTPTAIAWDGTDIYDADAAHDPASSNSKIIVPSAWNGKYGVLTAVIHGTTDLTANNSVSVGILKGATSAYDGFGGFGGHNANATQPIINAHSSIVLLTTGDEYTCTYWNSSDTSVTIDAVAANCNTTFGLRVLPELP